MGGVTTLRGATQEPHVVSVVRQQAWHYRIGSVQGGKMNRKTFPRGGPREKLLKHGVSELTDEELLALFLRIGRPGIPVMRLACDLLNHFGSLYWLLSADYRQFASVSGIGVATYAQFKAIAELARRYSHAGMALEDASLLDTSATKAFLQSQLGCEEREVFMVIFLDNQNHMIKAQRMFSGTLRHVEVHPREIVREAIKINAAAVILSHNHPSGRAEPSAADKMITERVVKTCNIMDIRVHDHIVVGRGECVSFAERGWI